MPARQFLDGGRVAVKIFADDVEKRALQQPADMAQLPIVFCQVAAMPDVHAGSIGIIPGSMGARFFIVRALKQVVCVKG